MDDPPFSDPLDVASNEGEGLIRPDLAFQRGPCELPGHRINVLPEALRRDPDDVLPLDPLVHENRRPAVPISPILGFTSDRARPASYGRNAPRQERSPSEVAPVHLSHYRPSPDHRLLR